MLVLADQLGAGLGAPADKEKERAGARPTGNAPLRLWVGERRFGARHGFCISCFGLTYTLAELYRRAGKEARAEKQASSNAVLKGVVDGLVLRAQTQAAGPVGE
jgi:hypothetical protein